MNRVLMLSFLALGCIACQSQKCNTLTGRQKAEGWVLLFDGKSFDGWHCIDGSDPASGRWTVMDGALQTNHPDASGEGTGKDIITDRMYGDFWLSVDFKIGPMANSGIKYFINPGLYGEGNASVGCEYQIIDDGYFGADKAANETRTLGSIYEIAASDKSVMDFTLGGWNTAWVIVRGSHVEHWLNGARVVEYDRDSDAFREAVSGSKFRDFEGFGTQKSGHILLQNHKDYALFRNVMIKEL